MQITLTVMTTDEARGCIERIKAKAEAIGADLLELRDREGWRVLGYGTFQDCVRDEFHYSRSYAHRLINLHLVKRALASPIGNVQNDVAPMPEAQARELAPLVDDPDTLRDVYADAVRLAPQGKPTAAALRAAVDVHLGVIEPSDRQAVVLQAIEDASPLLAEPDAEKALYALSRIRFWLQVQPEDVAEAAAEPAQDAPSYAALAAWVHAVADGIAARASGLRVVR